jgi:hypothetical protein
MDTRPRKGAQKGLDKSPYNRRGAAVTKKGFEEVGKSIKPVAKDTNKMRRKTVKPTVQGTRSPKAGSPNPRGVNKEGR